VPQARSGEEQQDGAVGSGLGKWIDASVFGCYAFVCRFLCCKALKISRRYDTGYIESFLSFFVNIL
jgi:hypothetical protein